MRLLLYPFFVNYTEKISSFLRFSSYSGSGCSDSCSGFCSDSDYSGFCSGSGCSDSYSGSASSDYDPF